MADMNNTRYDARLSTAELSVLLSMLEADSLAGQGEELLPGLSARERTLVLATATGSLRARRLIANINGGAPVLYRELLDTLGICVYPTHATAIYHWDAGAELPTQIFAFRRQDQIVLQTRPEAQVYEFLRLSHMDAAVEQILRFCGLAQEESMSGLEMVMPGAEFQQLRTHVDSQDEAAIVAWQARYAGDEAAAALLETLQSPYRATLLHALHTPEEDQGAVREMTILNGPKATWLIQATAPAAETIRVQTMTLPHRRAVFASEL
ncbi:MAG: hypothetical protein KDD92_20255 [Caldilineaceae bacterium]|nr:hypothetical protein [Caldilineaceae bacterium]